MSKTTRTVKRDTTVGKEFTGLFAELERRHLELKRKLNAYDETGETLKDKLEKEMDGFESWRFQVMDQLGKITSDLDPVGKRIHQMYIKNTRYFGIVQEAPFYWRIINKPNGYAGDAEMMSYIYRNDYEGDSPFGKFLHKHAVSTKACESVRNRKRYLTEQILATNGGRILSLAAGPAKEIREILSNGNSNGYRFLALDHDLNTMKKYQDHEDKDGFTYALANAFQIISGNCIAVKPKKLFERYCYPRRDFAGVRKVFSSLKYDLVDLKSTSFDLIYSAGLYDYIETFQLDDSRGTVALTKNLFNLLKDGGTLIVANFNNNNPRDLRFVMEYIFDWQLIHRDQHEVMEFARSIDTDHIKQTEIIDEPLGINYLLKITKRGDAPAAAEAKKKVTSILHVES